jgi:endonuclease YncB( thermonuclease family)
MRVWTWVKYTLAAIAGAIIAITATIWVLSISATGACSKSNVKSEIAVVDGDTVKTSWTGRIRLRKCDAPEMKQPRGPEARARLLDLIEKATNVRVTCDAPPHCDNFGRLVADLMIDKVDACDVLIAEGLASPYGPEHPKGTRLPRNRVCTRP